MKTEEAGTLERGACLKLFGIKATYFAGVPIAFSSVVATKPKTFPPCFVHTIALYFPGVVTSPR